MIDTTTRNRIIRYAAVALAFVVGGLMGQDGRSEPWLSIGVVIVLLAFAAVAYFVLYDLGVARRK